MLEEYSTTVADTLAEASNGWVLDTLAATNEDKFL